jgi:hypothetical protein
MNANRERLIVAIAMVVIAVTIVLLLTGCGTTKTKVVYDKVEIPKPYWDPPDAKPVPEEVTYQTDHLTPEAAEADPTAALVMVGQDFGLCRGNNELLRSLYIELLRLIRSEPVSTPPSDGTVPPG